MAANITGNTPSRWLNPRQEQEGLQRYLVTLRERWWMIVLCVLVAMAAALAYVSVASKVYNATADILVTPVSSNDDTLVGLGLIRDSNDPTRDVSTASSLIATTSVAQRVITTLHLNKTPPKLLDRVKVEPLAQSSIVTITAEDNSPEGAARLANAFADQAVAERTEQLRLQLDRTIPALRERLKSLPREERTGSDSLAPRISTLEGLRGVPDPTLRVTTRAIVPEHASSPRPKLALAAGIFAGLVLGFGSAFGLQALDPRVRREEQLRALFSLPILARIPREHKTRRAGALAPERLTRATTEAYRTLRTTLAVAKGAEFRSRSILVTGSSPSEGKSTTAINLAFSLVQTGNRVILIEADMRRPTIGMALGARPRHGIADVLIGEVSLEDALVTSEDVGSDLQLLLTDRAAPEMADRLSLPTAKLLISEAEALADYVVVDSPPLTEIIDALPLAQEVAEVLVVVRLNRTKTGKLLELGELLAHHDIKPAGIALVGVDRRAGDSYYYTTAHTPRSERARVK